LLGEDSRVSAAILLSGLSGLAIGPFVVGAILRVTGTGALFAVIAVGAAALSVAIMASIGPARRAMDRGKTG
jgi:hypothetical protein